MSDIIIGALTTGFGWFIGWFTNYCKERRDRRDRYYFAMLEKRFEVNQQAFDNVEELKKVIHLDDWDEIKITELEKIKKWFNGNNLYLEPDIRQRFKDVTFHTGIYGSFIEHWRSSGQQNGWESEETKKIHDEMMAAFKEIMSGIQQGIQKSMDKYFEQLD